ncbi:mitochondrial exoribonuclease Cyt-4 [Rhodotorula toruloides]|uniref:Mitochondrial exoribonuclease Cyt-4 n=1 Tax=Rhodotorula toruloides TaxID=5286 RepID=A0A511KR35_RHOTO|nr:mitochondrial exoribonuclease Cyt-4 [Rhodotorula toruloides]
MLSSSSRVATRRPAASIARTFASSSSTVSSSSSQPSKASESPALDPYAGIYQRVLRTAVYGTYEHQLREKADRSLPAFAKGYASTSGFKPTSRRDIPAYARRLVKKEARSKPVPLDVEQVEHSLSKRGRAVAQADLLSRREGGRRQMSGGRERGPLFGQQARSFSMSASSSRARVSEETIVDNDSESADSGGGLWDDAELIDGLQHSTQQAFQPGDFIETSRGAQLKNGIYICVSTRSAKIGTVLDSSGLIDIFLDDDVTRMIPGFVDRQLASSLKSYAQNLAGVELDELPEGMDRRPFAAERLQMLQKIRSLEIAVDAQYKRLLLNGGSNLYHLVRAKLARDNADVSIIAPTESIDIEQAIRYLNISRPTVATRVAMSRLLLSQSQYFLADSHMLRETGRFDLRSPEEVERFEQVRDWVRAKDERVAAWAKKCARLREWGRKQREGKEASVGIDTDRSSLGTFRLPPGAENEWTDADLTIFAFLRDTLAISRLLQVQPHLSIAPTLVKLVDHESAKQGWPFDDTNTVIDKARIRDFLGEVGVVAPWEDWTVHDKATTLPTWDKIGSIVAKKLDKLAKNDRSQTARAASKLYESDAHDSVRHDFGQARVYTIDDLSALELDDGVSILPAPSTSDGKQTHWLWAHIADPTTVLPPEHLWARLARVRDHTEYLPQRTWPMLPGALIFDQQLSLGAREGGEQRTLSIGVRVVEETGEVLDVDVKAGIVRNVLRLTYDAVGNVLGYQPPPEGMLIANRPWADGEEAALARTRVVRPTDDALLPTDEVARGQLDTMFRLAKCLLRRRVESTALFWQQPVATVKVAPTPLEPHFESDARMPTFYARSPRVEVRLPSDGHVADNLESPAHLLVSEIMVAANRAGARFAVEKGIPMVYRAQEAPLSDPASIDAILKMRNPATGAAPPFQVVKKQVEFRPGTLSLQPGPHWPMGIHDEFGYIRATSPLRRYGDMFAHYQLKSALLPPGTPKSAFPRFDASAALHHISGFTSALKGRKRLDHSSSLFWSLWVFKQKFELFKAASTAPQSVGPISDEDQQLFDLLANNLTGIALREATFSTVDNFWMQEVTVPELGLRGTVHVAKETGTFRRGESIPVVIDDILLGGMSRLVLLPRR